MSGDKKLPKVEILLSTYQGQDFLAEQLKSIEGQQGVNWHLFWRDDQSTDKSVEILNGFSDKNPGRVSNLKEPLKNLGVVKSFMLLLSKAPESDFYSFCDQDDVWFPDKIKRAVTEIEKHSPDVPVLYCSRQMLVDENLKPIGLSKKIKKKPTFRNALTQNIATGCTIVLNKSARSIVLSIKVQKTSAHDWLAYLAVTAAGGVVIFDEEPSLLYRQHQKNVIGVPNFRQRAIKVLAQGPSKFLTVFYDRIETLKNATLTEDSKELVLLLSDLKTSSALKKYVILFKSGLYRQGSLESFVFYFFVVFFSKN